MEPTCVEMVSGVEELCVGWVMLQSQEGLGKRRERVILALARH